MRVSLDAKLTAVSVLLVGLSLSAQQPPAAPPRPDTPAITAMIDAARKAAAPIRDAVHFWCEAPRTNRLDDPPIVPTRILDDVYAIGNSGTTVYVVRTTAGLLMIDALFANQVDKQLLPGFRVLGLDPAQVKIVLVTHGHADHFGGAAYFRKSSDQRCLERRLDAVENPPPARGGPGPAARRP
jgi:metallo-beta-lactamase class B